MKITLDGNLLSNWFSSNSKPVRDVRTGCLHQGFAKNYGVGFEENRFFAIGYVYYYFYVNEAVFFLMSFCLLVLDLEK